MAHLNPVRHFTPTPPPKARAFCACFKDNVPENTRRYISAVVGIYRKDLETRVRELEKEGSQMLPAARSAAQQAREAENIFKGCEE